MLERYVDDQRLVDAIACQGTIGTFAGPRDPGTAAVRLMHHQGDLLGLGSYWGYVKGGLGRASFAIADAALEAGATLAAGLPVAAIHPGRGSSWSPASGSEAPIVICNADPKRLLALLDAGDAEVPADYRERLESWDVRSPVMKLNVALNRFPSFSAAPEGFEPERAQVTITDGVDAAQAAVESARAGIPAIGFSELYFQSAYDRSRRSRRARGDERLLPVRPLRARRGRLGLAARRDRGARARRDRAPGSRPPRLHRGGAGHGAARHREPDRAQRRAHLPGPGAAVADVGSAALRPHARRRALPLRRSHPPRRLR